MRKSYKLTSHFLNHLRFYRKERNHIYNNIYKYQKRFKYNYFNTFKKYNIPYDVKELKLIQMGKIRIFNYTNKEGLSIKVTFQNIRQVYEALKFNEKRNFLLMLAQGLNNYYENSIKKVITLQNIIKKKSMDLPQSLLRTRENERDTFDFIYLSFFQQILNQMNSGVFFLLSLRSDLIKIFQSTDISNDKKDSSTCVYLKCMDDRLRDILVSSFERRFLELTRITMENSPSMLKKVMRYEAVHPIHTLEELRNRLGNYINPIVLFCFILDKTLQIKLGKGRRCFSFIHKNIPDEPLVLVHVAFMPEIATSMSSIESYTRSLIDENESNTAIFYSISSCHLGLQGFDLGNLLIKEVLKLILKESPHIRSFSTLSPIPGFMDWLHSKVKSNDLYLYDEEIDRLKKLGLKTNCSNILTNLFTTDPKWFMNTSTVDIIKPIVLRLGVKYIIEEKKKGKAICPVANFHLRNGAVFERINWLADVSKKGILKSAGMMINYKYEVGTINENSHKYIERNIITLGNQVIRILQKEA